MPWSAADAEKHIKGLTAAQQQVWARVANNRLAACKRTDRSVEQCEASAIRQANAVARTVSESNPVVTAIYLDDSAEPHTETYFITGQQAFDFGEAKKRENGIDFPRHAFAYAPDSTVASGWKLRLWEDLEKRETPAQIGRAIAALSPGGFRESLPNEAIPQVKQKLQAAWRRVNPDKKESEMPEPIRESAEPAELTGEVIELCEKAVRPDGTIPAKIIAPGQGSTGFYPAEVLKRDGPKIFRAGTHTYWDHPTKTEESDRPERSLRDLAGVLESDARWLDDGPAGPGLYADIKVEKDYQGSVNSLAKHIGVSIRAQGIAERGEENGATPTVKELTAAHSIDFVTRPGAGGQIIELFEAARNGPPPHTTGGSMTDQEKKELRESIRTELKKEFEAQLSEVTQERDRLKDAVLLREARDLAAEQIPADLPASVAKRILDGPLTKNPPVRDGKIDGAAYAEKIKEAVKTEVAYLESIVGSGRVVGLGDSRPVTEQDQEKQTEKLAASFQRLGFSESAAKIAAQGRLQ